MSDETEFKLPLNFHSLLCTSVRSVLEPSIALIKLYGSYTKVVACRVGVYIGRAV